MTKWALFRNARMVYDSKINQYNSTHLQEKKKRNHVTCNSFKKFLIQFNTH